MPTDKLVLKLSALTTKWLKFDRETAAAFRPPKQPRTQENSQLSLLSNSPLKCKIQKTVRKYRVILQKCHENGRKWLKMAEKDRNLAF